MRQTAQPVIIIMLTLEEVLLSACLLQMQRLRPPSMDSSRACREGPAIIVSQLVFDGYVLCHRSAPVLLHSRFSLCQ